MVETFLIFPSVDSSDSEQILISPIVKVLVFLKIICDTSTARPMLNPLALRVIVGNADNWIIAEVTYDINGFLPMKTVSLELFNILR